MKNFFTKVAVVAVLFLGTAVYAAEEPKGKGESNHQGAIVTCDIDEAALDQGIIKVTAHVDNIQSAVRLGVNGIDAECEFTDYLKPKKEDMKK